MPDRNGRETALITLFDTGAMEEHGLKIDLLASFKSLGGFECIWEFLKREDMACPLSIGLSALKIVFHTLEMFNNMTKEEIFREMLVSIKGLLSNNKGRLIDHKDLIHLHEVVG